jgi:hypothetical protein
VQFFLQTPSSQVSFAPKLHVRPQAPQLSASVLVSTHAVPQRVSPGRHAHLLAAQTSRVPHAVVHEPHASESSVVAAQRSVQSVLSVLQPHAPAAQPENLSGHFAPHALQWSGLVWVSAQTPEHSIAGALHTHLPD